MRAIKHFVRERSMPVLNSKHTDKFNKYFLHTTERETDRQTETDRQIERDRQAERERDRERQRQTDRQTDRERMNE